MKKLINIFLTTLLIFVSFSMVNDQKAEAASKTMYVTATSLNVRAKATIKSKIIATVKKNTAVTVQQKKGSWSRVTVNKKIGWVSTKYLSSKKPTVPKDNNLATGLKTVDKNKQLILVTSNGFNSRSADIQTFEKNSKGEWIPVLIIKGHIGKYGFTNNMREGGASSPVGKYTIGTAFGQKTNPGTKLPYRKITSDDVWVDDPKSPLYNTWQSKKKTKGKWKSAENMTHPLYKYGFVINYNTKRTPYKGSAIFFHIGDSYTLGCTATSEANVIKILKWLDPAKKPVIIQTPIGNLNNY
ncbi:SH3 domain-containing protein [Lederbergia citrea]|uniref:SH3 domain-containing protein n=1 Tax=Lederbergia citrea TaxID=2833581 RepID=A0A942Z6W7_9BACI|nr:SH3 domain-containing protein [Lederbergia citrea]MBS4179192.1 SH3 domain-containing protein [Lederbergia citrea]MBS4205855.1 SH3 domain-containing protein [Lederbergia citrea]MBS4224697.1 SH3 domain-containing protein [Lederbergia citrea]